jgi:hypothetical protein
MLRKLLAGALLALSVTATSLAAQTGPDCASGRARGAWDLPVKDQLGAVRGLLGDGAGHRLLLEARLTPVARDGGRIDGVLTPMTLMGPAPQPIAEVHGTYVVGPDRRGRFESLIVELAPATTDPPLVYGKLIGAFADPLAATYDPIGRFVGQWAICR